MCSAAKSLKSSGSYNDAFKSEHLELKSQISYLLEVCNVTAKVG
jgi:hypothetical protein